jgi:hypothetical protein
MVLGETLAFFLGRQRRSYLSWTVPFVGRAGGGAESLGVGRVASVRRRVRRAWGLPCRGGEASTQGGIPRPSVCPRPSGSSSVFPFSVCLVSPAVCVCVCVCVSQCLCVVCASTFVCLCVSFCCRVCPVFVRLPVFLFRTMCVPCLSVFVRLCGVACPWCSPCFLYFRGRCKGRRRPA